MRSLEPVAVRAGSTRAQVTRMPVEVAEAAPKTTILARLVPSAIVREHQISERSVEIGSSESAAVRDTDGSVQPHHARLSNESGRWYLEDLHTESGTFLNGRRIDSRTPVAHGDVVRCGTSALELVCELEERTADTGDLAKELEQLLARIAALEKECSERNAEIDERGAKIHALRMSLGSVRADLAHAQKLHEAALTELEERLVKERQDLAVLSQLCEVSAGELSNAQALMAELRRTIDSGAQTARP